LSAWPGAKELETDLMNLLAAARAGAGAALGDLLERYRPYLLMIANQEIAPDLQAKFGPSDIVQDSMLEAYRDFGGFQGGTREDLQCWLRNILRNNLANAYRDFRDTEKRRIDREVSLTGAVEGRMASELTQSGETPSGKLMQRERDESLEQAIDQLPEDYRDAIRLKKDEDCSWESMAERFGRSPEAVRKLYARAIEKLAKLLESGNES
jgi:RNA polymerase sigma-70 factor (ECF subfamily)